MAYRDERPMCTTCAVALEPTEYRREIDTSFQPQRGSSILPPRPLVYAAWTRWSCATCEGQLFEVDHLAELVDAAAGDVRRLDVRMTAAAAPTTRCPRCASELAGFMLFGRAVARCAKHGVWLEAGALDAILAAARPG